MDGQLSSLICAFKELFPNNNTSVFHCDNYHHEVSYVCLCDSMQPVPPRLSRNPGRGHIQHYIADLCKTEMEPGSDPHPLPTGWSSDGHSNITRISARTWVWHSLCLILAFMLLALVAQAVKSLLPWGSVGLILGLRGYLSEREWQLPQYLLAEVHEQESMGLQELGHDWATKSNKLVSGSLVMWKQKLSLVTV